MKKFWKYLLWFFIVVFGAIAVGVFATWASGAFNPKKIYIQNLNINGVKEFVTISENDESYTTKVNFEPANANQLALTVKVVTGADLIEQVPVVTAGENFTINFAKDNGVTKGGELELKFVDSSQNSYAVLKVLIDVRLGNRDLDFELNGTNVERTDSTNVLGLNVNAVIEEENANVIKVSAENQNVLNSYTGNWSNSVNNDKIDYNKLKKAFLHYDNTNVTVTNVSLTPVLTAEEKYYLIKFLSPSTTVDVTEPFKLGFYVYRTFNMEKIFSETLAKNIIKSLEGDYSNLMYDQINDFINNYVYESITNVDKINAFDKFKEKSTGLITLSINKLAQNAVEFRMVLECVRDYALVCNQITINVKEIKIENIKVDNLNLKYQVLSSFNLNTVDLKYNLGVSLVGDSNQNISQTILDNNLRQLNIYLTKVEDVKPEDGVEYFNIDENYFIKAENNKNDYFEIIKQIKDSGDVEWQLKTLSPIPSTESYALVYEYENKIEDWTEIKYGTGANAKIAYWHYDGVDRFYSKKEDLDSLISPVSSSLKNAFSAIKAAAFVRASAMLDINYTQGDIAFKNNNGNATVMLNSGNIYMNGEVVENGNGIYYKNRQYSVKTDVSIAPRDADGVMEYEMVKWFVKYDENRISQGAGAYYPDQYYFMPYISETNYYSNSEGSEKTNPQLTELSLKYIDGTAIEGEFMELGTGDLNLIALNAMDAEKFASGITLYAAIVQTDINGDAYIKNNTYSVISFTTSVIRTDYYVENLYLYCVSGSDVWDQTNIDNALVLNEQDAGSKHIYLTANNLDAGGNVVNSLQDVMDENGNLIIIKNGINKERNYNIALKRFYNVFLVNNAFKIENASSVEYPDNTYNIVVNTYNEDNNYIQIDISVSNVVELNGQTKWSYIFAIDSREVSYSGGYYTEVYSNNAYFQLVDSGSAESGDE